GSGMDIAAGSPRAGMRTTGCSTGDGFWGRMAVSVAERDSVGNVLTLHRAVMMSGRIVFDGSADPPAQRPLVFAEPANGSASLGRPNNRLRPDDATGLFLIDGLMPGDYFLRVLGIGDSWTVKSITWD